jgi:AraC-like DNA-binding protein
MKENILRPTVGFGESPRFSPIIEAQNRAFVSSRCQGTGFPVKSHYHSEVELIWVRSGKGLWHIGKSVDLFKGGDLLLVGPNLPHALELSSERNEAVELHIIQFLPKSWGNSFWRMPETGGILDLINKAGCGIQFVGRGTEKIGKLIESLSTLTPYSFNAFSAFIEICRHLLATEYRVLNQNSLASAHISTDQRLNQVISLVDATVHDKISQEHVASELRMSAATFSRWFKRNMGCTFQYYVNKVRLARVCADLAQCPDNITTIAMNAGYSNLANFNRRFREIVGTTPKRFRSEAQSFKIGAPRWECVGAK